MDGQRNPEDYEIYIPYCDLRKQEYELGRRYHSRAATRINNPRSIMRTAESFLREFLKQHSLLSKERDIAEKVLEERTAVSNNRPKGIYSQYCDLREMDYGHFSSEGCLPPLLANQEFGLSEDLDGS